MVLGDLNAVTGTHSANHPSVGPFPSGISNDNSDRFLTFCGLNGLSVLGSWFRRLNIHRWTWISHDGVTRKEIDQILVRQKDRGLFQTYRAFRGAQAPANTDHVLVAADLVFSIMKPKKTDEVRRPYDVDRLASV